VTKPHKPNPEESFRDVCADVAPLPPLDTVEPYQRRPPPVPAQSRRNDLAALREMAEACLPDGDIETGDDLHYCRPGLSQPLLRKLRRGQIAVQDQLDLHGMRTEEARLTVSLFLQDATARALRCVRIVHGKGTGSRDRRPVLKPRLAGWLVKRDEVLAYCSAPAHDGGTGAIYVLLKKRS
jgi:DNA-nicking Smr family endonuclease